MHRLLPGWMLLALLSIASPTVAQTEDVSADTLATTAELRSAGPDSLAPPAHKFRQLTLYFLGYQFATDGSSLGVELRSPSGRYAILGGAGYQYLEFEGLDDFVAVGSWGIGLKRYFDGGKHQFYAVTALGPVAFRGYLKGSRSHPEFVTQDRLYGNSLGLGYRYTSYRGFTFVGGYDVIWAHVDNRTINDLHLSLGWSW